MTYYVKGLIQSEYETKFTELSDFVVVKVTGLGGNDSNQMRGDLKEKGIPVKI